MDLKDFLEKDHKFSDFDEKDSIRIRSISDPYEKVKEVLKLIHDPEISVNIWDLGLIYLLKIDNYTINIEMTLTSPTCPVANVLVKEVENRVKQYMEKYTVEVKLVWEPKWDKNKLTDDAKFILGF